MKAFENKRLMTVICLVLLSAGTRLSGILIEKLRTASSLAVIESNLLILSPEEGVGVGARA